VVGFERSAPAHLTVMPAKAGTQSLPLAGTGGGGHGACSPGPPLSRGRREKGSRSPPLVDTL